MRIADVLRGKGGAVVTIKPDATVTELLDGLASHNIGAMVVPVVVVGLVELLQPSRAATRVPAARPRNESTPVRFIR